MPNLKEIKNSIESVKKTSKLTQAMKMVAAAKFKRASEEMQKSTPYLNAIENILTELSYRLEPDYTPSLMKKNDSNTVAVIIIAGDRGLCGGFNNNLLKFIESDLKKETKAIELYIFGNKGIQFFKQKSYKTMATFPFFAKTITKESVDTTMASILKRFHTAQVGEVRLYSNQFISALSSQGSKQTLAPISVINENKDLVGSDYIYEPCKTSILDTICEEYISYQVYKSFLSSTAGEEGARMTAMDSATDNAKDMIKGLTLKYNRGRQAQITRELSEIVAGANSLN